MGNEQSGPPKLSKKKAKAERKESIHNILTSASIDVVDAVDPEIVRAERLEKKRAGLMGESNPLEAYRVLLSFGVGDFDIAFEGLKEVNAEVGHISVDAYMRVVTESLHREMSEEEEILRSEALAKLFMQVTDGAETTSSLVNAVTLTAIFCHIDDVNATAACIFGLLDVSNDGFLDKSEMMTFAILKQRLIRAIANSMKPSEIEEDEATLEALVNESIARIDTNSDKRLDLREFQRWFTNLLRESRTLDALPSFERMRRIINLKAGSWSALMAAVIDAVDGDTDAISKEGLVDAVVTVTEAINSQDVAGSWSCARLVAHIYDFIEGHLVGAGAMSAAQPMYYETCLAALAVFVEEVDYAPCCTSLFTLFDHTNDGFIDISEMSIVFPLMLRMKRGADVESSNAFIADEVEMMRLNADANENTELDRGEFLQWFNALMARIEPDLGGDQRSAPTFARTRQVLGLQRGDFDAIAKTIHAVSKAEAEAVAASDGGVENHTAMLSRINFVKIIATYLAAHQRGASDDEWSHTEILTRVFNETLCAEHQHDGDDDEHLSSKTGGDDDDVMLVEEALSAVAVYTHIDDIDTVAEFLFRSMDEDLSNTLEVDEIAVFAQMMFFLINRRRCSHDDASRTFKLGQKMVLSKPEFTTWLKRNLGVHMIAPRSTSDAEQAALAQKWLRSLEDRRSGAATTKWRVLGKINARTEPVLPGKDLRSGTVLNAAFETPTPSCPSVMTPYKAWMDLPNGTTVDITDGVDVIEQSTKVINGVEILFCRIHGTNDWLFNRIPTKPDKVLLEEILEEVPSRVVERKKSSSPSKYRVLQKIKARTQPMLPGTKSGTVLLATAGTDAIPYTASMNLADGTTVDITDGVEVVEERAVTIKGVDITFYRLRGTEHWIFDRTPRKPALMLVKEIIVEEEVKGGAVGGDGEAVEAGEAGDDASLIESMKMEQQKLAEERAEIARLKAEHILAKEKSELVRVKAEAEAAAALADHARIKAEDALAVQASARRERESDQIPDAAQSSGNVAIDTLAQQIHADDGVVATAAAKEANVRTVDDDSSDAVRTASDATKESAEDDSTLVAQLQEAQRKLREQMMMSAVHCGEKEIEEKQARKQERERVKARKKKKESRQKEPARNQAQSTTITLDKSFDDFEARGMAHHESYYAQLARTLSVSLGVDASRIEIVGHASGSTIFTVVVHPGGPDDHDASAVLKTLSKKLADKDSTLCKHLPEKLIEHALLPIAETQELVTKRLQHFIASIRPASIAAFNELTTALLRATNEAGDDTGGRADATGGIDEQIDFEEFAARLKNYVATAHGMHEVQQSTIESIFRAADVDKAEGDDPSAWLSVSELKCALITMFDFTPEQTQGEMMYEAAKSIDGSGVDVLRIDEFSIAYKSILAVNKLVRPENYASIIESIGEDCSPASEYQIECSRASRSGASGLTEAQFCAWFHRVHESIAATAHVDTRSSATIATTRALTGRRKRRVATTTTKKKKKKPKPKPQKTMRGRHTIGGFAQLAAYSSTADAVKAAKACAVHADRLASGAAASVEEAWLNASQAASVAATRLEESASAAARQPRKGARAWNVLDDHASATVRPRPAAPLSRADAPRGDRSARAHTAATQPSYDSYADKQMVERHGRTLLADTLQLRGASAPMNPFVWICRKVAGDLRVADALYRRAASEHVALVAHLKSARAPAPRYLQTRRGKGGEGGSFYAKSSGDFREASVDALLDELEVWIERAERDGPTSAAQLHLEAHHLLLSRRVKSIEAEEQEERAQVEELWVLVDGVCGRAADAGEYDRTYP